MQRVSKYFFFSLIILFCASLLVFDIGRNVQPVHRYTLRSENDSVVLYSSDSPEPTVLDIRVSSLHEYDRKLLQVGIELDTPEQLLRIIEDFDG